jgi:basic amino acid/polyamine antiporter, APA family
MAGRWRTKSVEQSIADTDEPGTQLRKDLSCGIWPSSGFRW